MNNSIKMGTLPKAWGGNSTKTITFCVTENCNLKCKYCYMSGKNNGKVMSFEVAQKSVDYILSNREQFNEEAVVWDFIGGEPFLEIDLIDKITDYIKVKMYELKHPWFNKYRLSFSTNGILYDNHKVQKYLEKNRLHTSIGISVDGNKTKHDLQRVRLDDSGSYDDVMKNVPLWLQQFPNAVTKSTFSHEDLPYLKDSIIDLWNNGIKNVAANIVFEDVWKDGDPEIFEEQLKELADYVIKNNLWDKYTVRFFDPYIGFPLDEGEKKKNTCGSGRMLAIDCEGKLYPCVRFLDFSLNNRKGRCIGDINKGINSDKTRPFLALTMDNQDEEKCISCEVASGCSGCAGFNYDCFGTIYKRATFICEMHKANVRACDYFWDELEKTSGVKSQRSIIRDHRNNRSAMKYLMFITSEKAASHCSYDNNNGNKIMDFKLFQEGLEYCNNNDFMPVILQDDENLFDYDGDKCLTIMNYNKDRETINGISVFNHNNISATKDFNNTSILMIDRNSIKDISESIRILTQTYNRVNIILKDLESWNDQDLKVYDLQLESLINIIIEYYKKGNKKEINVLTDLLNETKVKSCGAGETTYALAPNGKVYICPAVYYTSPEDYIGDLSNGFQTNFEELFNLEKLELCNKCEAYHCKRCKYLNKLMTEEISISPKIQCIVSNMEKEKSRKLQEIMIKEELIKNDEIVKLINKSINLDPIYSIK